MIPIYFVIAILIIIILFMINYFLNHNIESFRGNSIYSANYILDNCQHNWAKNNNTTREACQNEAWITNPRYLCGICGNNNIPLISILPDKGSNNPIYYGCNKGQMNNVELNWNNSNLATLTSNDPFLSDVLTCNKLNKGSSADMYLFIQSTSAPTIKISNNLQPTTKTQHNYYSYSYYYQNVPYETLFEISVSGTGQGFGISYLWNKQLYILDHNGFQNCANIIKYNLNAKHLWGNTNNGYPNQGMLPWMNDWLIMDMNVTNPVSTLTIHFKIGYTQKVGTMNNDLTAWVGITNFGEVLINGKNSYGNLKNLWGNSVQQLTIPNIVNGNSITINSQSAGFLNTSISLTYLWHGILYSFSSSLNGFNNVIQLLTGANGFDNFSNIKYCNLPINYKENSGPCGSCNPNNYCIMEQTYYNNCNLVSPNNNLLFNTNWIFDNNSTAPQCGCCYETCCNPACTSFCCRDSTFSCQQMSNLSFTSTITDNIFPPPENNYV